MTKTITITEFDSNTHDWLEEKELNVCMNGYVYNLRITKREE